MNDEYTTIRARIRTELTVRGSRFIAIAAPVSLKEEVQEILEATRKEFYDATHHCYAYRLGTRGDQFRYYDDGEPGGTAGKPILAAVDKFSLTNVLVVVTRYFGGTKLGVGGLSRAYGQAAEKALARAEQQVRYLVKDIKVVFPHSFVSSVMHLVSKCGARIVDTFYDEEVHLTLEVRRSKAEEFKSGLVNQTNGNIRINDVQDPPV